MLDLDIATSSVMTGGPGTLLQEKTTTAVGAIDDSPALHVEVDPWVAKRAAAVAGDNFVVDLDDLRWLHTPRLKEGSA